MVPPHVVCVGRVVTGRKSDQTFRSALSVVEPHFWGKNRSPSLAPPPARAGRPVGPWLCRYRLFVAGLSVYPRTPSLLLLGLPGLRALSARRNCLLSFGGLVERRLVVRHHCAPLVGRWEWGLNEETPSYVLGSTSPRFAELLWGIRRHCTLPLAEERTHTTTSWGQNEPGRLLMIGASLSLGTSARCEWLSKVWVNDRAVGRRICILRKPARLCAEFRLTTAYLQLSGLKAHGD